MRPKRFKNKIPLISVLFTFLLFAGMARAEKPLMLESQHYRIFYAEKNAATAGEVLKVAERIWPLYAKAYDAYPHYQIIEIFLKDPGDYANGNAIYTFSRVEIFIPHLDWVMRGRADWVGNVVAHEIAHVFTLRRAARLSPFDDVLLQGYTFNRQINWSFTLPFLPLIAPNWYIEGIAQFEATEMGYDKWDSQRDMIVRDAWLSHTLPTLGEIETFDGDWIQGERVYNTGFAFLRYLKGRFGLEKVRSLAFPKPFLHFGGAVQAALGASLENLYDQWRKSLEENYGDYQALAKDSLADPAIEGTFTQNLAFSPNGRYVAWLGNGDRDYALNWIYWKDLQSGKTSQSAQAVNRDAAPAENQGAPSLPQRLRPKTRLLQSRDFEPWRHPGASPAQALRAQALQGIATEVRHAPGAPAPSGRSELFGASGLEFNAEGNRLLTTRSDRYSPYRDLWEYDFLSRKSEEEKWHRLTWNIRAGYPSYHPQSASTVVFVQWVDGSGNISVLDSLGRIRRLTRFREGQQCYNPRFSPQGDSIYFTLGRDDREAIAVISASALGFDEFSALNDSSLFPDSLNFATGETIRLVTPWETSAFRDLRFEGDTLLFASNRKTGAYQIYARLPQDSVLHRLTQSRTQALEPQIHAGHLYYQGYEKQAFRFFQRPVRFVAADTLSTPSDTVAQTWRKKVDYSQVFESKDPVIRRVAWGIEPQLTLAPRFLDDTSLSSVNVELGLDIAVGPIHEGVDQGLFGFLSKRFDRDTPLEYGGSYSGQVSFPGAWHTRFYWAPELGYSLSHLHQTRQIKYRDEGAVPDDLSGSTSDSIYYRQTLQYNQTYYTDMAFLSTNLPFSGLAAGPGYVNFGAMASWYRQAIDLDLIQKVRQTPFTNAGDGRENTYAVDDFSGSFPIYRNAQLHRNFRAAAFGQWTVQAPGTTLPNAFAVYAMASKWWARFAGDDFEVDQNLAGSLTRDGEPIPYYLPLQRSFEPWQLDFGWVGLKSGGEHFLGMFSMDMGTFLEKFPQRTVIADIRTAGNGQADTVLVDNPDPNLWVMTYRLGLEKMPGYPYNFVYQGNDILEGSAFFHSRLEIDLPFKIRKYLPYPSPLSSLNQIQLSGIADAGVTFDQSPDQIYGILERGDHHLLFDVGVRLSATFLMSHQIPMTLYFQSFLPLNQLRAGGLYAVDYARESDSDAENRSNHLASVKDPRYFVGFSLGLF